MQKKYYLLLILGLVIILVCLVINRLLTKPKGSATTITPERVAEVGENEPLVEPTAINEIYTNQEQGFLFHYPSNWETSDIDYPTVVAKFIPANQNLEPDISHIIIQVEFSDYTQSLNQVIQKKLIDIQNLPNSKVQYSGNTSLGIEALPAHKIIYEADIGEFKAKNMLIFTVKDNKAYVISYNSDKIEFEKNLDDIQTILTSFQFLSALTSAPAD